MNNLIGPTAKHVWNVAIQMLHIFFWFVINTTAYLLGQCSLSFPSNKELHENYQKVLYAPMFDLSNGKGFLSKALKGG